MFSKVEYLKVVVGFNVVELVRFKWKGVEMFKFIIL